MAITPAPTVPTPPTALHPEHRRDPDFLITEERRAGTVVLHLDGPLRLADAEILLWRVEELWAGHRCTIVLDLTGLTTGDELGVLVLPNLVGQARDLSFDLTLATPSLVLADRLRQLGFPIADDDASVPGPRAGPTVLDAAR